MEDKLAGADSKWSLMSPVEEPGIPEKTDPAPADAGTTEPADDDAANYDIRSKDQHSMTHDDTCDDYYTHLIPSPHHFSIAVPC